MRNHWILLTINIAIIVAVEASGSFFANSGLIHLIAVFFVILGLTRIWTHKDVYDRFLVPLIHSGIIGMLILALSHIFEYISFRIGLPHATVSANVVNAYMLTFLFITIGAESFLIGLHRADSKISISAASILALIFSGLFAVFFYFGNIIDLSPMGPYPFVYFIAIVLISGFCIWRLLLIRKIVSLMKSFINYFIAAILLICFAAIQSSLEEIITGFGVPYIQVVYLNHFFFYAALSLIFLAFEQIMHLEGVYAGLGENRDDPVEELNKMLVAAQK